MTADEEGGQRQIPIRLRSGRALRDDTQKTTARAKVYEEVYILPFAQYAKDGAPGGFFPFDDAVSRGPLMR